MNLEQQLRLSTMIAEIGIRIAELQKLDDDLSPQARRIVDNMEQCHRSLIREVKLHSVL